MVNKVVTPAMIDEGNMPCSCPRMIPTITDIIHPATNITIGFNLFILFIINYKLPCYNSYSQITRVHIAMSRNRLPIYFTH